MDNKEYGRFSLLWRQALNAPDCPFDNESSRIMRYFLDCVERANGKNELVRASRGPKSFRRWVYSPIKTYADKRCTDFHMRDGICFPSDTSSNVPNMIMFIDAVLSGLRHIYVVESLWTVAPDAFVDKATVCKRFKEEIMRKDV